MSFCSSSMVILFFFYLSWILSVSLASSSSVGLPLKAASLGNWLVTEGWMEPSMFSGITNSDLLDGTQVQFMSMKLKKYITVQNGVEAIVLDNSTADSRWQTFRLWRINDTFFNFRVINKQFIGLENQGQANKLVAVSETANFPETFQIVRKENDPNQVRIRASNGFFLQAKAEMEVTANNESSSNWEENDPSVFSMKIVSTMQGEYQITNGYGPDKASNFMEAHWKSYITEEDFKFMSENGLNAVRIPVGWWIAYDPTPPKPFVGGSSQALDNAFIWAEKFGLKVIVDLHALKHSQNGYPHSGSRDGFLEWNASYVQETVAIIDFLASRYAKRSSLVAIELMNEPLAPGVQLDSLKEYYNAGYETVRKYSTSAYVILSNRLGGQWTELLSFASSLTGVAIDVHYYNLFSDSFNKMSVQQNIDFIYQQRSSNLKEITTSNGPLSFVGEWTNEWQVGGATKEDYQRFAKAQLEVYGRATFGWAYWAYKCHSDHWNLRWMIENNYTKL